MDLSTSCGSRRCWGNGTRTSNRGGSKLQVRRVASGVGTLLRLAGRRHEMISRVEMVDRPQQCTRRDASDPHDAVSRRPRQRCALEQTGRNLIAFVAFILGPVRSRGLLPLGGRRVVAPPSCQGLPRLWSAHRPLGGKRRIPFFGAQLKRNAL